MKSLIEDITTWIRQQVEEAGASGVVFGLSGGVDSATVGVLAKRALGDNSLGLIMPCHSKQEDLYYANMIAEKFDIKTETIYLDSVYDKLLEILPTKGAGKIALGNLKVRLRMLTLYYFANNLNYLVVGSGNKSEIMTGYFTKYGDGAVDILPIGDLLKTQVKELAKELGIPTQIINRIPTAGLWEGQTDEGELGISYEDLDKSIKAIQEKRIDTLEKSLIDKVLNLIKKSEHKRMMPKIFIVFSKNNS